MSGKKEFNVAFWGFQKSQVNAYLEKLLNDFEIKLQEKNHEISNLKNSQTEFDHLKNRLSELEQTLKDRDVLIEEMKHEVQVQNEKITSAQSELELSKQQRVLQKEKFLAMKQALHVSIQTFEDQFENEH